MVLEKEVKAIEEACCKFIASYKPDTLTRVAERNLRPVVKALVALIKKGEDENCLLQVFSYPINKNFERAKQGEDSIGTAIICVREDATFHWTVIGTVDTREGVIVVGLPPTIDNVEGVKRPGFRQLSVEDLVALDVSLVELVQRIRQVVNGLLITESVNMPPAQA